MSRSPAQDLAESEFYQLVSDVKDEIANSDDEPDFNPGLEQHEWNSNSKQELDEFSGDAFENETPSIDDEIDIKYEVVDYEYRPSQDTDDDLDLNKVNIMPLKHESINSEEKGLNGFHSDLLLCDRDCLTCQILIRQLREHVRANHGPDQPTSDPLHVEPLDTVNFAANENGIKCEVVEDTETMDYTEESDNFDSEIESESENDPDYKASSDLKRNRKSGQKLGKVKVNTQDPSSPICQTKIKNNDKPFKCEECGLGLTKNSLLIIHLRTHTGEKPFKCEECGMSFNRNDCLTLHLRRHTQDKPFKCEECAKSFTRKCELRDHAISHFEERLFKCEECGKCFKTKNHVQVHMKSHSEERPWKCEECGKCFKTKSHVQVHRKSHSEERAYHCDTCDKDFKRPYTLYVHRKKCQI